MSTTNKMHGPGFPGRAHGPGHGFSNITNKMKYHFRGSQLAKMGKFGLGMAALGGVYGAITANRGDAMGGAFRGAATGALTGVGWAGGKRLGQALGGRWGGLGGRLAGGGLGNLMGPSIRSNEPVNKVERHPGNRYNQ